MSYFAEKFEHQELHMFGDSSLEVFTLLQFSELK